MPRYVILLRAAQRTNACVVCVSSRRAESSLPKIFFSVECFAQLHPLANRRAGFAQAISAEFFIVHARDFDVDINAVEDGTGDAFWYLVTMAGAQVQGFWASPKNPQGQGCTQ